MTNHGDDCYFFYYSTCSKGDSCPFRHCEAAMGNETVCNLWQEGRCFRTVCKFRHMEITKNRKEISCYWEKQPAGCQKPHCAFFHERPRFIEGVFVPLDKSVSRTEEQGQEEAAAPPAAALPATANPQLRGLIKTETHELVPSPTHPPVVINPADDDEDEDDQISEEGEDAKGGPSPRKYSKPGDSLNFGVSTLEEIRLRKALKASMKRAGYPLQSTQTSANREKENIQAFLQPALEQREDVNGVDGLPLKRSLAERLGGVVDSDQPSFPPQKSLKPVKERLGSFSAAASAVPVGSAEDLTKAPEQIHIKTLEEILREKASKSQKQSDARSPAESLPGQAPRGLKRRAAVKDAPTHHVTTFSDFIQGKKKLQDEENKQCSNSSNGKLTVERLPAQSAVESEGAEVKVKTLEEIRREKAARTRRATEVGNTKSPEDENDTMKRRTLQRSRKPATQNNVPVEKEAEVSQKAAKVAAGGNETNNVKVKSFEEIMREKRLRRQEQDVQAKSPAAEEALQAPTAPTAAAPTAAAAVSSPQKRKLPTKGHVTTPPSSHPAISPAPESSQSCIRVPTHKRLSIKAKAASNVDKGSGKVAAGPVGQGPGQHESEPQHGNTDSCSAPPPAKQARAGQETSPSGQRHLSRRPTDTKVRPKLNVKPSIMKPAVQVKPAQKKRAAEASAVAAVKPLTCSSSAQEEEEEEAHRGLQAPSSLNGETPLSSTSAQTGPSSSATLRAAPPTPDTVTLSPDPQTAGNCPTTQSPVPKTPPPSRSRRSSVANRATPATAGSSGSSSVSVAAVDDFDKLINEFTNDHLEEDVDPSIGEDDLLQELSQMIDS